MIDYNKLLSRFISNSQTWADYREFLNLPESEIDEFFKLAKKITTDNFDDILKVYIPNKRFPAVSITGSVCTLNCEHCNKKYLEGMKDLSNKEDLKNFLYMHYENNGVGVLISGGCDPDGAVPLHDFINIIREIKQNTKLLINVHTGLLSAQTAKALADAKVDIISFDITMDENAISEIYHLNKSIDDYKNALKVLKEYNLNVVPHLCVGLYYGRIHEELAALRYLKESGLNPSLIVIIALIPPKVKNMMFKEPTPIEIAKIIAIARFLFPQTEISLGCMRPKAGIKIEIEKCALKAGITRIELPSKKILKWLKNINPEIQFQFFSACCAIPKEYEARAKSLKKDLKIYKL
jgi:uncharacterized radical SAM superfamily protein